MALASRKPYRWLALVLGLAVVTALLVVLARTDDGSGKSDQSWPPRVVAPASVPTPGLIGVTSLAPRQTAVPRPSDRISACAYYAEWRAERSVKLLGNTDVIRMMVAPAQRTARATLVAGYEVTYARVIYDGHSETRYGGHGTGAMDFALQPGVRTVYVCAAPRRELPVAVATQAELCPHWVLWADGALSGDIEAVYLQISQDRRSGSFAPSNGYQITYKASSPRLLWTGDTMNGPVGFTSNQPIQWMALCARK